MNSTDFLNQNRNKVLENWLQAILESYPPDSIDFFKNKKDQFQNPVGHAISDGIEKIFDELLGEFDQEKIIEPLERIIKIRTVQEFSPAQATAFIFPLKNVIRGVLGEHIRENHLEDQLYALDCRIDRLALYAFDIYMQCREKLFEIRINQVKAGGFKLMERLNRRPEAPSKDLGDKVENN